MSLATLENAIVKELQAILCNPKLTKGKLLEWSTTEVEPQSPAEIAVHCPEIGVYAVVPKVCDRRPKTVDGR